MDPVRLGLAVRALRRRRGWTQVRLAEEADLSQTAVSRLLRAAGWEVVSEATFSVFGERGSIEVLA